CFSSAARSSTASPSHCSSASSSARTPRSTSPARSFSTWTSSRARAPRRPRRRWRGSMTRTASRWSLVEPDPRAEEALARELGVRPLLARLLVNRGLREPAIAASFLDCSLSRSLRSPMLFGEMQTAAQRILEALRRQERIAIYGDYDVDGITASTQLVSFLREL